MLFDRIKGNTALAKMFMQLAWLFSVADYEETLPQSCTFGDDLEWWSGGDIDIHNNWDFKFGVSENEAEVLYAYEQELIGHEIREALRQKKDVLISLRNLRKEVFSPSLFVEKLKDVTLQIARDKETLEEFGTTADGARKILLERLADRILDENGVLDTIDMVQKKTLLLELSRVVYADNVAGPFEAHSLQHICNRLSIGDEILEAMKDQVLLLHELCMKNRELIGA